MTHIQNDGIPVLGYAELVKRRFKEEIQDEGRAVVAMFTTAVLLLMIGIFIGWFAFILIMGGI